jgi:hypothetical protein
MEKVSKKIGVFDCKPVGGFCGMFWCECNMEKTRNFLLMNMAEHATVGIEALRCTGGAGETKNTAWDWVMEVAVRDRTD